MVAEPELDEELVDEGPPLGWFADHGEAFVRHWQHYRTFQKNVGLSLTGQLDPGHNVGMTTTRTSYTAEQALAALIDEGYSQQDAESVIDQSIAAGFELDQPDDGSRLFSAGELDVMREQCQLEECSDCGEDEGLEYARREARGLDA